ncbi:MAG: hypothetical protein H0T76_15995 [Nannocystis sp.]|nr:hypothetical protein [Nannocystis sp.]
MRCWGRGDVGALGWRLLRTGLQQPAQRDISAATTTLALQTADSVTDSGLVQNQASGPCSCSPPGGP